MSRHQHIRFTVAHCPVTALLSLFLLQSYLFAQEKSPPPFSLPTSATTLTLSPALKDSLIRLPHTFVAAASDTLLLDSMRVLVRLREYTIDYRAGAIKFDPLFLSAMLLDTNQARHRVTVRFAYFPFQFQELYTRRQLIVLKDTTGADTLRIAHATSSFNVEDIFGPNLQKSGSIVRGFTVGSNRDLSLNSGLRMQLSGKLSSDIEIAAALTDENTPIQPEGTTQTLQEFDKVFVEIKSSDVAGTFGDFNLDFGGSEFARLSRKLQGAKGEISYRIDGTNGSATVAGALTRGKYTTNQFNGLEGVQGPYRLSGRNGERSIIVIAGTERVYIDGEQKTRGETNDYTIDYSLAEVTFTPRRLITAASRIVIDFEYTDRQYSRSLLGAQTSNAFLGDKLHLSFAFVREADDPNSPIDLTLTDSARVVLQNAGADRNKAVLSGVTPVDSGGYYIRVDTTLVDGSHVQFYRYAPGNPAAKYNVAFSNVGTGRGDYTQSSIGVFVWNGPGGGDYLPLRFLPLPQLQQVMDVVLDASPSTDLKLSGEFGRSLIDVNRFSSLEGVTSSGNAFKFSAAYAPRNVRLGGLMLGGFDFTLNERYMDGRFVPVDRTNDIEFNRKWGIDTTNPANEEIREGSVRYYPDSSITIGGGFGRYTRGEAIRSTRYDGSVAVRGPGLPTTTYQVERISSRDQTTDEASSWVRQKGSTEYTFWKITPGFRYEGERRELTSASSSEMQPGSFSFDQVGSGLLLKDWGKVSLAADYSWRGDNLFDAGSIMRESNSFTQAYTGRLATWNNLSSALDITLRTKAFTPTFKQLGNSDIQTVLVRSQSRYAHPSRGLDADVFYEVSTERTSRLERVFVRVTQGTGNYKYLGDLNGNGLADENEFELTRFDGDYIAVTVPTDALFPIIDLKTSFRLRFSPGRMVGKSDGPFEAVLSALSGETYVRVEEKSSEHDLKQIYLLHFNKFQQDSTTITGSRLFSQDLYLFEGQPAFSTRFRFSEGRGLNNFSGGIERNYSRERSMRIRWQLVREISNQIDYVNKIDRVMSQEASSRVRDILSNDFAFDLSYRPEQNLEVGFKFDVARSTDRFQAPELQADLNTQSLRMIYAFQGAGQARLEASREEITLGRTAETFPYELTGGRVVGKTWIWRAAFDYRVTNFLQATMNYDGRTEGGRAPVHTARAEIRAFF